MAFIRSGRSIVNTPTGPSTANLIVSYPITQLLSHFHPFPLSHLHTFHTFSPFPHFTIPTNFPSLNPVNPALAPLLLLYYSYLIHPAHPCSIILIQIETAERRDKHGKASQRSFFRGLRPNGPQAQGRGLGQILATGGPRAHEPAYPPRRVVSPGFLS